jgi:hypothetical protein
MVRKYVSQQGEITGLSDTNFNCRWSQKYLTPDIITRFCYRNGKEGL